jgi:hypothetical protein
MSFLGFGVFLLREGRKITVRWNFRWTSTGHGPLFGLALPIPCTPLLGCRIRSRGNGHVAVDRRDHAN